MGDGRVCGSQMSPVSSPKVEARSSTESKGRQGEGREVRGACGRKEGSAQSRRMSLIELSDRVAGQYLGFLKVNNHEFIVTSIFLLVIFLQKSSTVWGQI